jgi:hypothetical protein
MKPRYEYGKEIMNLAKQLGTGVEDVRERGAPASPTLPRWTRHNFRFLLLRSQEVLRFLDATERSEHHVFVIRAASDAATLACQTDLPLLVFPELFRELADAALKHECRQESLREFRFNLLVDTVKHLVLEKP